jgi:cell division transport system permease protein
VILDLIWASGPEARLLPAEGLHGPTVAVTAIMTFVMMVAAAAGLSLANAAAVVVSGTESRYVIELSAAAASELPTAVEAARSTPGVRRVAAVPQSELRKTLERWLGDAAKSSDLPIPAMATVELAPGADPALLRSAVSGRVAGAVVSAESVELKPLLHSIRAIQWLSLSLAILLAGATAAAVMLAARGALDTHRSTVEIMHGIGATDHQINRLFERKIAIDAIAGALAATLAAAAVLLLIGGGVAAAVSGLGWSGGLGSTDLVLLALIPVAAVVIAVAVAHWTLLRALRASL